MELQLGDVIELDQKITEKAIVMSNNSSWFLGTMGCYKSHKAIRVDEVLLEGGIENESK
jgi:flagellar motor switch protein FliM